MTPSDHKLPEKIRLRLNNDSLVRAEATGYSDFILARAYLRALNRGEDTIESFDVLETIEEFRRLQKTQKSWAGFFYASGGALLSVGLGGLFANCVSYVTRSGNSFCFPPGYRPIVNYRRLS